MLKVDLATKQFEKLKETELKQEKIALGQAIIDRQAQSPAYFG